MDKQTIVFRADDQTLVKLTGADKFASNIVSYIDASFDLGNNWGAFDAVRAVWVSGTNKIATVLHPDTNSCKVPAEILRHPSRVLVNLIGSTSVDGELQDRLTTYPVLAFTINKDVKLAGNETPKVTPSQFEQYVSYVREYWEDMQDYKSDAEAWAIGKRAGADVEPEDPTYDNNSKYYAERAREYVEDLETTILEHVDNWLDEHPEATTTVQDDSLTTAKYKDKSVTEAKLADAVSGKINTNVENVALLTTRIATLDSRVDQIVAPTGEAPSAAEVFDARVGEDGITYTNLGDAIRTQVVNLKSEINEIDEEIGITLVKTTASTEYNDDTPTGTAISTTQRWFLNGFAYGRIDSVSIRFRLAGEATIEVWEKNDDTLTRIHTETVSCSSNYTWKTFTFSGVESDYPMMVSVVSDTTNGISSITNTSKDFNAKYISPSTTPPLSYSALNTFAGLNVTAYVTYTYYTKLRHRGCLTVSKTSGFGDYTNIADAVTNAIDGDTILVYPGTYTEPIEAWGKTIDIIGVDKNTCIITNDTGNYSTPAVEIDSGRIANFTIISTGANPTCAPSDVSNYMRDYSIHVDDVHATGKTLIIENCIIRNNHRTALGMGCYANNTVIVRNCDIWADVPPSDIQNPLWNKRGVLYFHNRQPSAYFSNITGQKMRFINNTMYCEDIIAIYIGDTCKGIDMEAQGWVNEMEVEFINNMICAKYADGTYKISSNGISTPTAFENDSIISGTGFTEHLKLSPISYGNNVEYLNA